MKIAGLVISFAEFFFFHEYVSRVSLRKEGNANLIPKLGLEVVTILKPGKYLS